MTVFKSCYTLPCETGREHKQTAHIPRSENSFRTFAKIKVLLSAEYSALRGQSLISAGTSHIVNAHF